MNDRLDKATRVIEYERAQIGHELHDALLPLIFAASAAVGSVIDRQQKKQQPGDQQPNSNSDLERLRQAAGLLDDAMQTGRRLLTQVYPPELNESGWTELAQQTIERLLRPAGSDDAATPIVQWQCDRAADQIEPSEALAAYRIVVEAVRNAVRHGSAEHVQVSVRRQGDRWQITIHDDGIGFDPGRTPPDRFGIRSMRGRAELVDGQFEIESKPGGPTQVTLWLKDG